MAYTSKQLDEFIAYLRSDKEARARVRAAILGEEFLSLPEEAANLNRVFAAFMERSDRHFAESEARTAHVDARFDKVDTRFDGVDERMDGMDERFDRVDTRFDKVDKRLDEHDERFDRLETKVDGLSTTVAGLTTRVDGLTTTVDGLTTTVDGLTTRVDGFTTTVAGLTTTVDGLSTKVDGLATKVDRLDGRVGNLDGWKIESEYRRNLPGRLGRRFRQARILDLGAFQPVTIALDENRIDGDEWDDLFLADAFATSRDRESGAVTYIVLEFSRVVDRSDVERAARRAAILRKILPGEKVVAAVDGERVTAGARTLSQSLGVVEIRELQLAEPEPIA